MTNNIHPKIIQYLPTEYSLLCCPFCQHPLKHMKHMKKAGYVNDQYYSCNEPYETCRNDLYIGPIDNKYPMAYMSFKFPETQYDDYAIQLNFENDIMTVHSTTAHCSPVHLLTCPIPQFNLFDLPLLTKKIKLYQTFS